MIRVLIRLAHVRHKIYRMPAWCLLSWIVLFTQDSCAELITQSIAQVGDHLLTSRELELNAQIEKILFGTATDTQPVSEKLQSVILEYVVYLEAKSFDATQIADTENRSSIKKVIDKKSEIKGKPTDAEIEEIVRVKLISKEFIRFKTSSSMVPVSDEEAQNYFDRNRAKFAQFGFEHFKDNIKRFLAQEESQRRLKDWFEILQKKHKIRLFSPQSQTR